MRVQVSAGIKLFQFSVTLDDDKLIKNLLNSKPSSNSVKPERYAAFMPPSQCYSGKNG